MRFSLQDYILEWPQHSDSYTMRIGYGVVRHRNFNKPHISTQMLFLLLLVIRFLTAMILYDGLSTNSYSLASLLPHLSLPPPTTSTSLLPPPQPPSPQPPSSHHLSLPPPTPTASHTSASHHLSLPPPQPPTTSASLLPYLSLPHPQPPSSIQRHIYTSPNKKPLPHFPPPHAATYPFHCIKFIMCFIKQLIEDVPFNWRGKMGRREGKARGVRISTMVRIIVLVHSSLTFSSPTIPTTTIAQDTYNQFVRVEPHKDLANTTHCLPMHWN